MKRYISERRLSGRDQIQAELEVLDTHYVEVGGIIAEHWGLPPEIAIGVKYQHDPDKVTKATSDVTHLCYRWIEFLSTPVSSGNGEIKSIQTSFNACNLVQRHGLQSCRHWSRNVIKRCAVTTVCPKKGYSQNNGPSTIPARIA